MIGVSKFKRKLEEIVKEMEKLNVRKVWSSSLHKYRKNNFKVHPVCSYVVKKFETGNYDDIKI